MPWRELKKPQSEKQTRIGVLGSGQLAQMMITEEDKANAQVLPWSLKDDDPAALVASSYFEASGFHADELREFLGSCDHVIFENEFVDTPTLRQISNDTSQTPHYYPSLDCLELLRNKFNQKKLLRELHIPSAPFEEVLLEEAVKNFSSADTLLGQKLGSDYILKWALFGYDGKGTFFRNSDPNNLSAAESFLSKAEEKKIQVFAEKRISFSQELALISVADHKHNCIHFPLVISEQKNGVCHHVQGPALSLGLPASLQGQAEEAARKLASRTKIVGTFAIEFFLSQDDAQNPLLLVNEIAPRVHNSGHFSQDGADESQFLKHLLAIQGKELRPPQTKNFFGMLNLLGPSDLNYTRHQSELSGMQDVLKIKAKDALAHSPQLRLHWYGKKHIQNSRKLGHINYWADSREELNLQLEEARKLQQTVFDFLRAEEKGFSNASS